MSNTTNLGLFKHDNPPTNENQFDVEKSLNENWDKIDEFAGEQKDVNSKVTTQKQQIENLNKQYTQLNQGLQTANIQIGVLDSLKAGKAETEKQFRKISKDQERQDKEINGLKDSAINITTDKQKSLHITDSSNLGAKILPFGNSEQETRSGKNILNINSSELYKPNGTTIKIEENKINVTSNNNPVTSFASIPIDVEPNTDYMFSGIAKVVSNSLVGATSSYVKVREEKNSGSWVSGGQASISQNNTQNQELSFTFNSGEHTRVWLWLYIKTGDATGIISVDFSDLQVEKGTEQTEYEKYGASPSPQFPSPIKNVGSNINMLKTDASGWEQGGLNTDTGDIVSSTVRLRTKDYIAVKSNTDYYVSIQNKDYCFVNILMYSDSGEFLGNYSDKNFSINGTTSLRVNFGASCDKIKVLIKNVGGTTINVDEIPNIKPQLEESSVFTAYREYNCGNIGISVFNKNWADGNRLSDEMKSFSSTAVEKIIDNRNCIRFSGATFRRELGFEGLKNNYKENTQYIIKFTARVENTDLTSRYALFMQAYNKNGEMIGSVRKDANGANWIDFTFTTNKNSTLSFIAFSFGTATYWYLDKDSIQIYEATDEGDCPVYEGQKIVFPLEEGQRLMLGDTLIDGKIVHNSKKFVIDGTEKVFGFTIKDSGRIRFSVSKKGTEGPFWGTSPITICNIFGKDKFRQWGTTTDVEGIAVANDQVWVCCENVFGILESDDTETGKTKIKNYLANNNIIFEQKIETPETEDFTEDQKTASEQLQNADMYKPVTNITTEDNMALIEANYIADTKTYIDNKYNNLAQQIINQITGGN